MATLFFYWKFNVYKVAQKIAICWATFVRIFFTIFFKFTLKKAAWLDVKVMWHLLPNQSVILNYMILSPGPVQFICVSRSPVNSNPLILFSIQMPTYSLPHRAQRIKREFFDLTNPLNRNDQNLISIQTGIKTAGKVFDLFPVSGLRKSQSSFLV